MLAVSVFHLKYIIITHSYHDVDAEIKILFLNFTHVFQCVLNSHLYFAISL
jgi:hypothetical protein